MKKFLPCILLWLVAAGCASPPWGDRDQRIGSYTYQQALKDMGPPKNSQKLPDGSIVAHWLIQRGQSGSVGFGMGGAFTTPGFTESSVPFETSPTPNRYLRLTFGSDGRLTNWERFYA